MGNFFSDTWKDLTQPGWRQANEASKLQQQALSAQGESEAFKQSQAKDLEALARAFLTGGYVGEGASGFNVTGALPQAQQFTTDYLNFLRNAADTTYNAERSALERGIIDARNEAALAASRRGGIGYGGSMDRIGLARAKGLSQLAGNRVQRQGQNLATGSQITQGMLDRALNLFTGAKGAGMGINSQIPALLSNQANQALATGGQPGILQSLVGAYAQGKMQDWLSPKTSAPSGGGNSWASYLLPSGQSSVLSSLARSYLLG